MRLFDRKSAVSSWRKVLATVATVVGLTTAGGLVAGGTASADPWNPNVNVVGRVTACGNHSFPLGVHYWGNTGDRGWVPVGRDGRYLIPLHRVGWRGEFVAGWVDCAWHRPAGFGYRVDRPWRGLFTVRDIR